MVIADPGSRQAGGAMGLVTSGSLVAGPSRVDGRKFLESTGCPQGVFLSDPLYGGM